MTGSPLPLTLADRVHAATRQLEHAGLAPHDARLDAEVLARHVLSWPRSRYLAALRDAAPPELGAAYETLIARRCHREPVSQITGHREFWGREMWVTRNVLTPRPETELLVEAALEWARERSGLTVLDLGTGSGCLAVTLAAELPDSRVTAVDVSPAALAVARQNASHHHVGERITFVETSWTDGLQGRFDLIVTNPPYIRDGEVEQLQPEVRDHEPRLALTAGLDGFDAIRAILDTAPDQLASDGRLLVEIGAGQEGALGQIVGQRGELTLRDVRADLQGIPRVAVIDRG